MSPAHVLKKDAHQTGNRHVKEELYNDLYHDQIIFFCSVMNRETHVSRIEL
jgi:hypothetical protein